MPPAPQPDLEHEYQESLRTVRQRILGFLIARGHDRTEAEDVAQDCMVALLDRYREVRDGQEMIKLGVRIAFNRICQVYRDRKRVAPISEAAVDQMEFRSPRNPDSGRRIEEKVECRDIVDRVVRGMLGLQPRCRELLRLLLIEQKSSDEIRAAMGIESNYLYVLRERCFRALRRSAGGSFYGTA